MTVYIINNMTTEYQEIAKHRIAGTVSNVVVLEGLPSTK